MGRKFSLQKKCDAKLNECRVGSFRTKQSRKNIMFNFIESLAALHLLPISFDQITADNLLGVVNYWKNQKIADSSILTRLAVLRSVNRLLDFNIAIPTNNSLGLKLVKKEKPKLPDWQSLISKPLHPLISLILHMQYEFGLTKLEVIRLSPLSALQQGRLMIHRSIAENRKDRMVVIATEAQKQVLEEWHNCLQGKMALREIIPEADLAHLYRIELTYHGIDHQLPIPHYYIRVQFNALKEIHGETMAMRTTCQAMALSSTRVLARIVQ